MRSAVFKDVFIVLLELQYLLKRMIVPHLFFYTIYNEDARSTKNKSILLALITAQHRVCRVTMSLTTWVQYRQTQRHAKKENFNNKCSWRSNGLCYNSTYYLLITFCLWNKSNLWYQLLENYDWIIYNYLPPGHIFVDSVLIIELSIHKYVFINRCILENVSVSWSKREVAIRLGAFWVYNSHNVHISVQFVHKHLENINVIGDNFLGVYILQGSHNGAMHLKFLQLLQSFFKLFKRY